MDLRKCRIDSHTAIYPLCIDLIKPYLDGGTPMVNPIEKILFTTDLSKNSIDVFEQTVALAAQLGACITMLHVIEDKSSQINQGAVYMIDSQLYEAIRNESKNMVRNVLIGKQKSVPEIQEALSKLFDETTNEILGADHPVTIDGIEVRAGNAAEEIIAVAQEIKCDLIALGHYHKGSLLRALTGSAGKRVLKRSNIPIFLVPLE